jgi:hypothetical protein
MIVVLWCLAFLSPTFALVGAIFLYRQHCLARPKHRIPVFVYAAMILISGVVAYFFGMIFGNDFACSSPSSGNLCPLAGIFIIGPVVSAFGILLIGSLILLLPRDKWLLGGGKPRGAIARLSSRPVADWSSSKCPRSKTWSQALHWQNRDNDRDYLATPPHAGTRKISPPNFDLIVFYSGAPVGILSQAFVRRNDANCE